MEGKRLKDQESWLETGLLVLGIIIAVGMAILAGGRTITARDARLRRQAKEPGRGEVKAERHQHVSSVAAR